MFYEKKNIVIVKLEYRQIFFNRFIYLGGWERERETMTFKGLFIYNEK